jgi:transcriptional regulator GlxA family with amidase domain
MGAPHRIGVVIFDGVKSLDASGPLEAFDEANAEGAEYELLVLAPGGRTIRASNGLRIGADAALEDRTIRLDTVIVAGADHLPVRAADPGIVDGVRHAASRAGRVASVCTGSFLLGAAGLLDGRRATTHWRHSGRLQAAFPTAQVEADALFVRDGPIHTSAGVTAGIDLSLALIEADHGGEIARRVARSLVVFLQRPGSQSQFSPSLSTPRPTTPSLRALFDAIATDPTAEHSTATLASRVAMSPRHFTRLFGEETGMSPHRYVELVRVQAACAALDAGSSVTAAVERAGFPSVDALRRAFRDRLAVTPSEYQARFATTRRA